MMADWHDPLPAERWTRICRAAAADIARSAARLTDRIARLDQMAMRPGATDADLADDARQIVLLAGDIATAAGVIQRRGDRLAAAQVRAPKALALEESV